MDGNRFDPAKTGLCMAVFYLVPSARVRADMPPQLEVIDVLPGMTLGGVYAARLPQGEGAALNEFGVMPSYVRYGSKKGYFLKHFCGDSSGATSSCMIHDGPGCGDTEFDWAFTPKGAKLELHTGGTAMIAISMRPLVKRLPISSCFHFMCTRGDNVLFFKNRLASAIGLSMTSLTIPDSSPLSEIPLKYKLFSTYWEPSIMIRKEQEAAPSRAIRRTDEAFGSHMSKRRAVHKHNTEVCLK